MTTRETIASALFLVFLGGCTASTSDDSASNEAQFTAAAALDPGRSYDDRSKLVALLAARHPAPPEFGDPRDGMLAITEWQQKSGRGMAERDETGVLTAWWPLMNYHLLASQFVAMKRRGEFSDVPLIVPDRDEWRLSDEELNAAAVYYDIIDDVTHAMAQGGLKQSDRDELEGTYRRAFWTWHDTILRIGEAKATAAFSRMPRGEQAFAHAFTDAFEPIMGGLGAPPHSLRVLVPLLFPPQILRGDAIDSNLSNTPAREAFFLVALKAVERVELEEPIHHPLRSASEALGRRTSPREIDPLFDKVVEAMSHDGHAVEQLVSILGGGVHLRFPHLPFKF